MAATGQDNGLRDRLASAQRRVSSLRDQRKTARDERDQAKADFDAAVRRGAGVDSPEYRALEQARARVGAVADELENAKQGVTDLLAQMSGAPAAMADDGTGHETLASLARFAESNIRIGSVGIGEWIGRGQLLDAIGSNARPFAQTGVTDVPVTSPARRESFGGIVEAPRRRLRLLDLFPSAPLDNASMPYLREVWESGTDAAETAEGALKPATEVTFVDAEAHAETVANFTKTKRQMLADVGALAGVIKNRLTHAVLVRLENQMISGTGHANGQIDGLLGVTGVGLVEYDAAELAADQALEGITTVLLSDCEPNFVALNPRDWADMLKVKATGSGEYMSAGAFAAQAERLWNTPTVPTPAVPVGKALVGDAPRGATVLVREGVQVLVSDSDQDDFIRNVLTILGEGRFSLAVWQPQSFAVVELAAPAP
jgi:HK97 family phage major capsid protein